MLKASKNLFWFVVKFQLHSIVAAMGYWVEVQLQVEQVF